MEPAETRALFYIADQVIAGLCSPAVQWVLYGLVSRGHGFESQFTIKVLRGLINFSLQYKLQNPFPSMYCFKFTHAEKGNVELMKLNSTVENFSRPYILFQL